jgi:hypothetical protein
MKMASTIYGDSHMYSMFCQTEGAVGSVASQSLPTACINNSAHTLGYVKCTRPPGEIAYEDILTYQNHCTEGMAVNAPASTVTTQIQSWPHPLNLQCTRFTTNSGHTGDTLSIYANINLVGNLTQSVSVASNSFQVSASITPMLSLGYEFIISGSGKTDDLGRITATSNNTIYTERASGNAYSVGSTVISWQYHIKNYQLADACVHDIGKSKVGSKMYVPANTPITIRYQNASLLTAKSLVLWFEYTY